MLSFLSFFFYKIREQEGGTGSQGVGQEEGFGTGEKGMLVGKGGKRMTTWIWCK
jgi:hypothetical protein